MARIIVTADTVLDARRRAGADPPVLLDERISSIHLGDEHAAEQLVERLAWAVDDAEAAERRVRAAGRR